MEYLPGSIGERFIGNGEEALARREEVATALASCVSEAFMSSPLWQEDGIWYLTMPTEDPQGWMVTLTYDSFNRKPSEKVRPSIRWSIPRWLLIYSSKTNRLRSYLEVLPTSQG